MLFLFPFFISAACGYQTCVTLININSTVELFKDLEETTNLCHETENCISSTSTVVIFDPAEEEFAAMSVVESCTLPAPSTAPSTTPTATSQPISGIYIDWYTAGVAAGLVLAFLGLLKVVRLFPYTYVIQQSDIRYRRAGRTSTNETTLSD
jgi:hypothetical protein